MYIPLIDMIERKILNYFDCPYDPDPRRLKLFWKLMVVVVIVAFIGAAALYVLSEADPAKALIVAGILLVLTVILHKLHKPTAKAKAKVLAWWHGQGNWTDIIIYS